MKNLTAAIKEDHDEMYEYHALYQKARESGNVDAQERWARQLIWEIARHAVGEEIIVYPLMEAKLGQKGIELADHDRREHQVVKILLSKLEGLTPVMEHLKPHNDDEEKTDLPMLEPVLGEAASQDAASQFSRTKKFVPTRAHPSAPNRPPYEILVGFLAMPLDKLQDLFAKFPTEEMKSNAKEELGG
ncbi:hypothetical protein PUNSTDRAFT_115984 [Punctularia strigosozonata HHB-11173 SS5]|uniref:uncharacterized protein n=1 Tax=Punctularia strigosozonata (strain HHB-11173) TaxID=741275 RepID=UPI00044179C9|nr:uncharacterized protein PUNSTDRAFT_115984 [Punctularia strigosozonata HHB-11173 SS5]EIN05599.1 hypothetical protein PUNSTDRAFT_115984 [Punctularia strigosozonata HHB-11173 SS5]